MKTKFKQFLESVEEINVVDINGDINWNYDNVYPFFAKTKNGDEILIGPESTMHSMIENEFDVKREDYPFQGRIWTEFKIIGFWQDETDDVYHLPQKFFTRLGEELGIEDIMDYKISISVYEVENVDYSFRMNDFLEESEYDFINGSVYIPLKDYFDLDIEDYLTIDVEEINKQKLLHIMNAKEKQAYYKKHGKAKGFGSHKTSWDSKNPIAWRQAKLRSENNSYKKRPN